MVAARSSYTTEQTAYLYESKAFAPRVGVPVKRSGTDVLWRTACRSTDARCCVQVAVYDGAILIGNTKQPAGPVLSLSNAEWSEFTAGIRHGDFDDPISMSDPKRGVQVTVRDGVIGIAVAGQSSGPVLSYSNAEWSEFVAGIRQGDFDDLIHTSVQDDRSDRPLSVVDRINELIRDLVSEPQLLFVVDSRDFECLVAEILLRRGYDVIVTRASRDGGVDIYASRIEPNGLHGLYLVQCKRQSQRNTVGVRPVRELYGVVCARNATGGIVVTTSFFTSPAIKYQSTIQNRMALQDNSGVLRWLRETNGLPNGDS